MNMPCYMMATKAIHKLGDVSSDEYDLIESEDGDHYIGWWVEGIGLFNVKFPKETTRKLTNEEIAEYNQQYYVLSDNPPVKMKVD